MCLLYLPILKRDSIVSIFDHSDLHIHKMSTSDRPVKNASGRYDNVDFSKAAGFEYPPMKCSYNRRDVLLFVSQLLFSA